MSIDLHLRPSQKIVMTQENLKKYLADNYLILKCDLNKDNLVNYFAVNPKDPQYQIYGDYDFEFFLQDTGYYWYKVNTRDEIELDKDNFIVTDIISLLDLEYEFD